MSEGRRSWMAAGLVAVLGLWAAGAWGIETQSCTDDPSACGPTGSDDPPANQNDPPANQGNGGGGDGDGGQPPPDRDVPFAPGLTLEIRDGQPYRVTDRTGQAVHHFDRNPDCSDPNTPGCTDGEDPAVRIHPCEMDNTRPECANFGTNLSPADMNEPLPPGTETCEGVFAEAAETGPETGVDAEGEECACGDEGCQCGPTLKERFQAAVEGAVDDAMYQTNRYLLHETERLLNTCDAFDSFRLPGLRDLPRFGDMFGGGMYYNQGGLLGGLLRGGALADRICQSFKAMGLSKVLRFGNAILDLADNAPGTLFGGDMQAEALQRAENLAWNTMGAQVGSMANYDYHGQGRSPPTTRRRVPRLNLDGSQRVDEHGDPEYITYNGVNFRSLVPTVHCMEGTDYCRIDGRLTCCPIR